jgi:hypothetical protein
MAYYEDSDREYDYEGQTYAVHDEPFAPQATMGITTKVPPAFDGRGSWFAHEEMIDDWVDLTTLTPDKHGPALKNRLSGEAAVHKPLLDRDRLRDPNEGVQYLKDTLRPHFVKGSQSVFLWRFFQLLRSHRGNTDFVR